MFSTRRRIVTTTMAALASLVIIAATRPSTAEAAGASRFAAIAYSPNTGRFGYAYGFGSLREAENDALRRCGAADARIVAWVQNGWVALALGNSSAYGFAWSTRSLADAERMALQNCAAYDCNPYIAAWVASG